MSPDDTDATRIRQQGRTGLEPLAFQSVAFEAAAGLLGPGVAHILVDPHGLAPGGRGSGPVAHPFPGVPEPDEGLRLVIPVDGFAKELDRLLVAVGRAVAFAEAVVGEAEAVQRCGLAVAVVAPSLLGECFGAALDGLDIVAGGGQQPTDRVERPGFPRAVTGQPLEPQRLATVCECLVEPAVQVAELAVVVQRLGLASRIAEAFV